MKEIVSASALSNEMSHTKYSLILLDFFATWCGPCKTLGPLLEKMQEKYTNVLFLKINTDKASEIAEEYSISAMPTVILLKKQGSSWKIVSRIVGLRQAEIEKAIQTHS